VRAVRTFARRLVALWRAADRSVRRAGSGWYAEAHRTARRMARECGVSLATAAGVMAAISPRLTWKHNVNAARTLLSGGMPTGVFRASVAKARRILLGERPLKVLSGPKVRAFYRALMGDESAAVVDVWTARAAGLDPEALTPARYEQVAQALRLGAAEVGTTTARLQAVAWVAVRGRA
jgi:hypothetical protein